MNLDCFYTSNKQDWGTPQELFDELNKEFNFTLDPCASEWNAKCKKYYTETDCGLSKNWDEEVVFCNPPYNEVGLWVKKASESKAVSVVLTFARTDVKWFHNYVYDKSIWIFTRMS